MLRVIGLSLLLTLQIVPAWSRQHRSHAAIDAFKHAHVCPSTGKPRGRCPGYVIDHIKPLCAGGPDEPSNMQWQTTVEGKAKDEIERRECAHKRSRRSTRNPVL